MVKRIFLRDKEKRMNATYAKVLVCVIVAVIFFSMYGVRLAQGYNKVVGREYVIWSEPFCRNQTDLISRIFYYEHLPYRDEIVWGGIYRTYNDIEGQPKYEPKSYVNDMVYSEHPWELGAYSASDDGLRLNWMNQDVYPEVQDFYPGGSYTDTVLGVTSMVWVEFNITMAQVAALNQADMTVDLSGVYSSFLGFHTVSFYWRSSDFWPVAANYTKVPGDYIYDPPFFARYAGNTTRSIGSYFHYQGVDNLTASITVPLIDQNWMLYQSTYGLEAKLAMMMRLRVTESSGNLKYSQPLVNAILIDAQISDIKGDYVFSLVHGQPFFGVVSGLLLLGGAYIMATNTPDHKVSISKGRSVYRPVSVSRVPPPEVVSEIAYEQMAKEGWY